MKSTSASARPVPPRCASGSMAAQRRRRVVGGDVAVWFGELDEPHTERQLRVRALDPELVWLAHEHEPWRAHTV
jgi:hypothetical protein